MVDSTEKSPVRVMPDGGDDTTPALPPEVREKFAVDMENARVFATKTREYRVASALTDYIALMRGP